MSRSAETPPGNTTRWSSRGRFPRRRDAEPVGVRGLYPQAGDVYTIIDNDGTSDAVTGTFAGLAEGAVLTNFLGSGLDATISYAGGDGNNVVISVQSPTVTVAGTGGDDAITIRQVDVAGVLRLQVLVGGTVVEDRAAAGVTDFVINGGDGADTLTLDYSQSGGFFAKSVTFNGGNPTSGTGDALVLTGGWHLHDGHAHVYECQRWIDRARWRNHDHLHRPGTGDRQPERDEPRVCVHRRYGDHHTRRCGRRTDDDRLDAGRVGDVHQSHDEFAHRCGNRR